MSLLLRIKVDDATKLGGIERGPTDQCPVNVGLRHEFVDGIGCDTASVQNTGGIGCFLIVHFRENGPALCVHGLATLPVPIAQTGS